MSSGWTAKFRGLGKRKFIISKLQWCFQRQSFLYEYRAAIAYQKGRNSRHIVYEKRNRRGAWACYDGEADGRSSFDVIEFAAWERDAGQDVLQAWEPRAESKIFIHVVLVRILLAGVCKNDGWRTVVVRVAADLRIDASYLAR